ncbi:hypothetical protein P692DRAFT_20850504 [Suillus brevipes Sb2]|nr:hypothetical protein P692DRAFT_20850504 [Suillus brevipes Sb2]
MACTGNARSVKRVRPQLTTIQKSARREKFVSLTNDINDTRAAYMDEVQGLAKKHGQYIYYRAILTIISIHYQIRALDMTSVIPWRENSLLHGDRWKLTEFIEAHNGTLKHDYAKLTTAQKNTYVIEIMKRHIEKQKLSRDMLTSFAAMDQEWMALCSRFGIEGFYIAIRGSVEDLSGPKLFFSEKAEKFACTILDSDPWRLALKLEAFVVSGLDADVSTTQPRSLNKLISECRTHIQDELAALFLTLLFVYQLKIVILTDYILREKKITNCNYANYERSIVERYGITLQGWPSVLLPVQNPSGVGGWEMSSNRECHANGEAVYKPRKKCAAKTTAKSAAVVNSDTNDSSSSSSDSKDE